MGCKKYPAETVNIIHETQQTVEDHTKKVVISSYFGWNKHNCVCDDYFLAVFLFLFVDSLTIKLTAILVFRP